MDKEDDRIRPILDQLMKEAGLDSREELLKKIEALMDSEEIAEFRRVLEAYNDLEGNLDMALTASLFTGFAMTGLNLTIRFTHLIHSGLANVAVRVTIHAIAIAFTRGVEAAKPLLALASNALRLSFNSLKPWASAPANIGRIAGYSLKFTKFLGYITLVIDGLLLIIAAIQGAQQRTDLQNAIKELLPQRCLAKYWEMQSSDGAAHSKMVSDYIRDMRDEADDPAYLKKRAEKIVKSLQEGNESITIPLVLDNLRTRDANRIIPTFTDEDLSDEEIKRIVEEENERMAREGEKAMI